MGIKCNDFKDKALIEDQKLVQDQFLAFQLYLTEIMPNLLFDHAFDIKVSLNPFREIFFAASLLQQSMLIPIWNAEMNY